MNDKTLMFKNKAINQIILPIAVLTGEIVQISGKNPFFNGPLPLFIVFLLHIVIKWLSNGSKDLYNSSHDF